jgi:carbon storage regulator CsrA
MLVLTRKTNESICIGPGIEVMVVGVRGNRVRLGFRAPADVSIQRKERLTRSEPQPDGSECESVHLVRERATPVGLRS